MTSKKMAVMLGIMFLCICVGAKQIKTKKTPQSEKAKDSTTILKTDVSKTQRSSTTPVAGVEQSKKKITLCISRAGLNTDQNQTKEYWLSPVLETYYYFKFSFPEQLKIIPRKSFSKSLQTADPYGTILQEKDLVNGVKKAQGEYVLIHTYSIDPKNNDISYSLKILEVSKSKAVLTFIQTFPFAELNNKLDECVQSIFDNFKITLPEDVAGLLKRPVILQNRQSVVDFGQSVVIAEADTNLQSAADKLAGMLNTEPTFALAVYKVANIFHELHNFEQAAQYWSRLIMRNGFDVPGFYVEASRNFRYCQLYNSSQRIIALAENKSINSPALSFEKELTLRKGIYAPEGASFYKQALNENPDNPDAQLFLSYQYRENGAYDKALSLVNRMIDETVVSSAVYVEKALILMSMNKFDDAMQCLASARALAPQDSTIPALYGDVCFAKKDYATALAYYGKAFGKMPRNMYLLLKISESYRVSGNPQMALQIIDKNKITFSDTNRSIIRQTGLIFHTMGDTGKARKILESCVNNSPPDTGILITLGELYATGGNREKAIEMFNRAAPLVKDRQQIDFSIGKIYFSGNDATNAEKKFLSVYEKRPDYHFVNKYLGLLFLQKSQYKTALAHFLNERKYGGDDEQVQQDIARLYVTLGDPVNAEKESKKLVELNPKNASGYILLAEIALQRKQMSEADRNIAEAENIGVVKPVVYKDIAKILSAAGQDTKAIETYRKYLKNVTDDVQAWTELSQLYRQTKQDTLVAQAYLQIYACDAKKNQEYLAKAGNIFFQLDMKAKAYDAYSKYIEKAGLSNNEVTYTIALIELDKKNYTQVLKLVNSLKEGKNTQQQVANLSAQAYYGLGKFKEAVPYIKQYLGNNPQDINSIEMLATAYEKLGFIDGAIESYQKFLRFKKTEKHPEYAFRTANLLENSHQDKAAIAQYAQNITLYPDDIRNYEHLSALYVVNKKYDFAITTFEKMMKLPSIPYEYEKKLAGMYYKTGNKELAIATYEHYLKNKSSDPEAWYQLGMIYYDAKMYDQALNPLSYAYDLKPDRPECLLALGSTYIHTNSADNASRILRQSLRNNAKDKEALVLLTECYIAAKDTVNLIEILEKRSSLEPADFEINSELGRLFIHAGKIDKAIQAYERARKARPTDESTRHILFELNKKKI